MEISLEGLVGLQGSLGGRGDGSFSIKAFLAVANLCSLFFSVFLGNTGMWGLRLVTDFGDSKGEGNSLDLDLEEAAEEDLFWNTFDDWKCGLDGLEDDTGLLYRDLGESGGLGVISDCGLGDDEGVVMSFESVLGVGIFLDVCQDVSRKPEFRRGRFWNISPNSSTELCWKTWEDKHQNHYWVKRLHHRLWSTSKQLASGTAAELQFGETLLPTGVKEWLQLSIVVSSGPTKLN